MNRLLAALCLIPFLCLGAPPPQSIDLDLSATSRAFKLAFAEGTTPLIRANLKNAGAAYSATGWTGTLYLQGAWEDSTVIAIASTATGANNVDFQLDANDSATSGVFVANFILTDGTFTVEWQRGTVEIRDSPGTDGAAVADLTTPLSFSGYTFANVASGGPYRVGTNITFSTNGDGSVNINSKVTGTAAAGRILYGDADGTWKALAAGTSGYVLQSNGAAAPSWVIGGGGSGDLTEVKVSGGLLSVTSGTGPIPTIGLTQTTLNALYLRLVGDTMTGDLMMTETDGTFRSITMDATNVADEDSVGAVYFTASGIGQTASVGATVGTSGDGMVLAMTAGGGAAASLLLDGVTDVATFSGRVIADNFQGNGEDLTLLTADQLTGDIPAASFGEVRMDFLATSFTLRTVEEVGYTTYSLTSGDNSIHVPCFKSANTSEQDFILHSAPVVVPRGFTAFKTTGAIDIDWIADSTTVADIRGIRLIKYVSGTPTVLYSDTTTRNVGTINTPANISINASAFTSTTISAGDHLVLEITGTIEDGACLAILHGCIHSN